MRVAVTGAQGYLGKPLVAALAAEAGVEEVLAIDVRPAPGGGKVRTLTQDVRDPALADDLAGINALVHLAFVVLGRGRNAESINVTGSRNAFTAALRAGVGTIVHASSAAAYGSSPDNPVPIGEGQPLRPYPPFYYPQTKVAVERLLDELERSHPGTRFVRLRPVSTLGPGAPRIARGRAFISLSDYDPLMQFTWIDDVVAAFLSALHNPHARGAYNVGGLGPLPASEVAALIGARAVRLPYRLLRTVARFTMDPGWVDMLRYPIVVDTRKAHRELGWRAREDCATALRRYQEVLAR